MQVTIRQIAAWGTICHLPLIRCYPLRTSACSTLCRQNYSTRPDVAFLFVPAQVICKQEIECDVERERYRTTDAYDTRRQK
jgi:hypothetical protein